MAGIISHSVNDVTSQFITQRIASGNFNFNFTKTRNTYMSKIEFKTERKEERKHQQIIKFAGIIFHIMFMID